MVTDSFSLLTVFALLFVCAAMAWSQQPAELDSLDLPPLLRDQAGRDVTKPEQWPARRAEMLQAFREHVYGEVPPATDLKMEFQVIAEDPQAMGGRATLKQVQIQLSSPRGEQTIPVVVFIPNSADKPAPGFIFICNREASLIDPTRQVKSPFWPAEEIVDRGYAALAFQVNEVAPDEAKPLWNSGLHRLLDPQPRTGTTWGTIAAWAWAASRVLDFCERDPALDATRMAVIGHSRGGKTALWAGAEDPRFALVISNNSGCTGAALARRKQGERVRQINDRFPHWFCDQYKQYNDQEEKLPVDQHQLLALVAPRLLYVASASEDAWADPQGEFLACVAASPAWRLFGQEGLTQTTQPAVETPLQDGRVGYHLREGKHDLTLSDWQRFMDFADRHLK